MLFLTEGADLGVQFLRATSSCDTGNFKAAAPPLESWTVLHTPVIRDSPSLRFLQLPGLEPLRRDKDINRDESDDAGPISRPIFKEMKEAGQAN